MKTGQVTNSGPAQGSQESEMTHPIQPVKAPGSRVEPHQNRAMLVPETRTHLRGLSITIRCAQLVLMLVVIFNAYRMKTNLRRLGDSLDNIIAELKSHQADPTRPYLRRQMLVAELILLDNGKNLSTPRCSIDNEVSLDTTRAQCGEMPSICESMAFGRAAEQGNKAAVKMLLEEKADPNEPANGYNETPLQIAARKGHTEVVKVLLGHGADINRPMNGGLTPLYSTVLNNRYSTMRLLLEQVADPNKPTDDGFTPLHKAAFDGNLEMTRALLQYRANPAQANVHGKTPLDHAVWQKHEAVKQLLLEHSVSD